MGDCFYNPAAMASFSPEKMKKVNLFESPRMFCDVYCLEPGQNQPLHTHNDNDKLYYVLSGTCSVQIGEQIESLSPGHLAIAPAGVAHGVQNDSEDRAILLVSMAPHPNYCTVK